MRDWKTEYADYVTSKGQVKRNICQELKSEIYRAQIEGIHQGKIALLGVYTAAKIKTKHHCLLETCGHEWLTAPDGIKSGRGCPECGKQASVNATRRSQSDYEEIVVGVHKGKIQVVGSYIGAHYPITHRCLNDDCKYEWETAPNTIKYGSGCPRCSRKLAGLKRRRTQNSYIKMLTDRGIQVIGEYTTSASKITHRCLVDDCSHEWDATPSNIKSGKGCPECGHKKKGQYRKLSHEDYVNIVERVHDNKIKVVGIYAGDGTKIEHRCLLDQCCHIWHPVPSAIKRGSGCPKCAGQIVTHKEYVGSVFGQHGESIQILGRYINGKTKILHRCMDSSCNYEWLASPTKVSVSGTGCPQCSGNLSISHEEYLNRVIAKHNDKIKVISLYKGADNPILHRCMAGDCCHEWNASPYSVANSGTGCPKCAGKYITHEDYIGLVKDIHGDSIEVLESYVNAKEKILHRCNKISCLHEWRVVPPSITASGTGCPKCAGRDHDALYIWNDEYGAFKIGITTYKLGLKRVYKCAALRGCEVHNVRMIYAPKAKVHEEYLHSTYTDNPYAETRGDGYTEFRTLTQEQLKDVHIYFDYLEVKHSLGISLS